MVLKVRHNQLCVDTAQEIVQFCIDATGGPSKRGRYSKEAAEYCMDHYGLSIGYLNSVGIEEGNLSPSMRTLACMELEVWIKNPKTGAEEKLEPMYPVYRLTKDEEEEN